MTIHVHIGDLIQSQTLEEEYTEFYKSIGGK